MRYESIVVGTDGSESATDTVRRGAELARTHGASLHIVAAYRALSACERDYLLRKVPAGGDLDQVTGPRWAARAALQDAAHTIRDCGLKVRLHAIKGDPASALGEVARRVRADVIVVADPGARIPRAAVL